MAIAAFMSTAVGRLARIVLGVAIIVIGLAVVGGAAGWVIALVGLVPIVAGVANFCLLGPILGAPLNGNRVHR